MKRLSGMGPYLEDFASKLSLELDLRCLFPLIGRQALMG